ncbi:hypothetical protein TMatcc_000043 [Talaromyces marneffei ATCC 18224]|uniref:Allergenic cerato-platanin Asp F13 n=1 Tax=Talaromyces marneffei (strain ATCC 18224 / CBS 334.59 / QM 7333) TaxID=441960 RepID=B6QPV2_TALMQ|nr:allergenic cerato-platanin Asp F13 [Talaromyces marneffei ATCC 18224]KAE8549088.1 hypothetical protein EYB25_007603 [Talaromyces marneffei]
MKNFPVIVVTALITLTANAAPAETTPSASAAATSTVSVQYDTTYDNSAFPISKLACSDGPNGLQNKGYSTLGQLPDFPYVGASPTISGWNSPNCGACYNITYNSVSLYVMGVDSSTSAFVVSQATLDRLTGGQAVALGQITAYCDVVDSSHCVT